MDGEALAAILSAIGGIITAYAGLKAATRRSDAEISQAVHDALEQEHQREAKA